MTDKKINWGGPAFPEIGNIGHNSDWQNESGMTLRDWFAGKALAGLCSVQLDGMWMSDPSEAAKLAYAHADAMIAAREGGA